MWTDANDLGQEPSSYEHASEPSGSLEGGER
jgi:hypothetical protein